MDRATLIDRFLARAKENLHAARLLAEADLPNACVTRAYFAVFQALNSALAHAGKSPAPGHEHWNHRALQASVHELTDRSKSIPAESKETLWSLQRARNDADYASAEVNSVRARRAVAHAEGLVRSVLGYLERTR
jgi:uncharacterized protein (UPF0332 family)